MPESNNVHDWLREGEALYERLLSDRADVERQIRDLEARLGAKLAEINHLARILGKPALAPARRGDGEAPLLTDAASAADEPVATRVRPGRAALNAKFATERVVATPAATRLLDAIPGRNAG